MGSVPSHAHVPHLPQAVDERSSPAGLRTVALFEALKGLVVLGIGLFLIFTHKHAADFADSLLYHLHIDPDRRISDTLMDAAWKVTNANLWTIAAAAVTYAAVRFTEGWGLWRRRVWAEWFALLSGALYLPWEILKLIERVDWERLAVLAVNIVIILYMLYIRILACRSITNCEEAKPS